MGKILVLAEKPSVGRELARVLGCKRKGAGCLIGDKYIVTWALGHLVTLADPEAYDDKYKTWSFDTLPMLPDKMKLTVIPQTSKQYNNVKKTYAKLRGRFFDNRYRRGARGRTRRPLDNCKGGI